MDNLTVTSSSEKNQLGQEAWETIGTIDDKATHEGGKAPLEIFPLEVWCLIFDNFTAPKDLASCSNASTVFRDELKGKSTQFLFEQVLPILLKNGTVANEELFNFLLDFRPACRSWKTEVDSFLENHPCHYHLDDLCPGSTNNPSSTRVKLSPSYLFSSTDKILQCIVILRGLPPKNAGRSGSFFVGRSIIFHPFSVNRANFELWMEFSDAVQQLLNLVGEEIWYCEFRRMDWLANVLHAMPNLKVLQIGLEMIQFCDNGVYPLPDLPCLQVLKVRLGNYSPRTLLQFVDQYKDIKKLELDIPNSSNARFTQNEEEIATTVNTNLEKIQFPNLEELCLKVHSEEEMLQLGRIILNNTPALHGLSLVLPNCAEFQDFGLIFSVLQNKTEVPIKSLKLTLKSLPVTKVQIRNPLYLPKLEELIIDTGENVVLGNIDFILTFESLQKLTLIQRERREEEAEDYQDSVVKFVGFENRLYESNIWKLLPKLDQVLIQIGGEPGDWNSFYYERAAYEKFHEEN